MPRLYKRKQLATARQDAAALGIHFPDKQLVLRALAPMHNICPSCKAVQPLEEWVYLPKEGQLEAYCWNCLHKSDYARQVGVKQTVDESEAFIQDCVQQIVPDAWLIKRAEFEVYDIRERVMQSMYAEAVRRFTPCMGRFSRRWHINELDYIDSHLPCRKAARKIYCTRLGFICSECIHESAYLHRTHLTQRDEKLKLRLVCEGSRFLAIMAGLSSKVPGLESTWALQWIDWGRSEVVTTDSCLTWPFCPDLEADEVRLSLAN